MVRLSSGSLRPVCDLRFILLYRYSDLQLEDMAIESMNEERMADMLVRPLFL